MIFGGRIIQGDCCRQSNLIPWPIAFFDDAVTTQKIKGSSKKIIGGMEKKAGAFSLLTLWGILRWIVVNWEGRWGCGAWKKTLVKKISPVINGSQPYTTQKNDYRNPLQNIRALGSDFSPNIINHNDGNVPVMMQWRERENQKKITTWRRKKHTKNAIRAVASFKATGGQYIPEGYH